MNKLDQLIKKLCPNGVEYKELGEICEIHRGVRITKRDLKINGEYPVVSGGIGYMGYTNNYNREANTITIAQYGTAGYVNLIREKFWANDVCFTLENKKSVLKMYLYYFLLNNQNHLYSISNRNAVPFSISKDKILKITIPIPPLEVQEEIVRILDTFTELTNELTNELEYRKKQYEYYRNSLLTFDNDVEYKELGLIGKVSMCRRIHKGETLENGKIPFFKIGTFGKKADAYISEELFKEYKAKYEFPEKGNILLSASGTIGKAVIYDGKDAYFQDSNIVWLKHDNSIITNKYLYHFYSLAPWKIPTGGTISRLYNNIINKTKIPIPPLEVQEKIVKKLDYFDKLVNDISEGLPAEIEMRQQQYEYYRNKLLSFKKINETK